MKTIALTGIICMTLCVLFKPRSCCHKRSETHKRRRHVRREGVERRRRVVSAAKPLTGSVQ